VISAAVSFAGMRLILNWPAAPALAFAVLIAATDPVAVIALFKDLKIVGRVRLLVETESLFNDGVAAVFFSLALTWIAGGQSGAPLRWYLLLTTAGGGILVGIAIGTAALLVAGRTGDALVETAVTVAASYGAFLLAESLHCSGVLATVATGLVVGGAGLRANNQKFGLSHHGRVFAVEFWEFLAFLANSAVFLLIGIAVSQLQFIELGYTAMVVVVALVLLGRLLSIYPLSLLLCLSRWRISMSEQHVLFWGGLRGALGLALALSLPSTFPLRGAVVIATFIVVTFSVVVQGLTMPALLRQVGLRANATLS
jgi:CPA1 family monovalent cation:H+ antiporter